MYLYKKYYIALSAQQLNIYMAQSQTGLNINGIKQINAGEKQITHQIQLRTLQHALQNQIQPPHLQQKRREQGLINQTQQIPQKKEIMISRIDPSSQNLNPESLTKVEKNITIEQIQPIFYSIPNNNTNRQLNRQCQFCAQFMEQGNFEKAFSCMHLYCKKCLNTYCQNQLKNYKIICCPQTSCRAVIDQNASYFQGFSQQNKQKYNIIKFRKNIQENPNLVLCPDQKCTKGFMQINAGDKTGQCKQCNVVYCLNCKVKSHSGKCQNFEQILLKDKFKYKKCYGCKRVVERNLGCPHMTCKCGSQFCYYCGEKWGSPHRCIRYLAGGELITDKLNTGLKCLRHEDFEYQYNIFGFLMRIPYYIVCLLIMTLYICWALVLCVLLIVLVIAGSSVAGYFAIQYKLYHAGSQLSKIVFVLMIIFIPIGFLIGWVGLTGALFVGMFPKFAELTLSGRLVPCLIN